MKILQWNVLVKHNPGKFFHPIGGSPYLSGIRFMEHLDSSVPIFSSDFPVFYSRRDARFLARELRRVGYNAYKRPALFFVLKQRRAARQAKAWK